MSRAQSRKIGWLRPVSTPQEKRVIAAMGHVRDYRSNGLLRRGWGRPWRQYETDASLELFAFQHHASATACTDHPDISAGAGNRPRVFAARVLLPKADLHADSNGNPLHPGFDLLLVSDRPVRRPVGNPLTMSAGLAARGARSATSSGTGGRRCGPSISMLTPASRFARTLS